MKSPITRKTRTTNRSWSRLASAALWLAALVLPIVAQAEPSARWLLIVDTSLSMQSRAKNTEIAVHDLLASGMSGQMARGDTLGVWTYNNQLHTGEASLQTWSPEEARVIADRTTQFVAEQKYEKSTDIKTMMKEMLNVVQASDLITVIIVSDADDAIKGTPFDAKINEIFKQRYRQQKKIKMPFITVLRGEKGKLTAYTVNLGQFAVEIPPIKREAPQLPPQPKAPPKPIATLPPLIIIGKKPEPVVPAPVAPTPVPAQTNALPLQPTVAPATDVKVPAASAVTSNPPAPLALTETPKPVTTASPVPQAASGSEKVQTAPVPAELPSGETQPVVAKPAPATPKAALVAEQPKGNSNPPARETAVAVTPQSFFSQRNLFIAGIILLVVAVVSIFAVVRRSRAPHTSLITSSLDRDKK